MCTVQIVYFSHSYRKEDAPIVRYFTDLIRAAGLVPILDPPSEAVNAARLQRHLRDSDGMVVVLTRRDTGISPHILFEAALCLQARKPILIFIEDTVVTKALPERLLRSRFSRKWYFRQVRDHHHALQMFRAYLGTEPPPRYQPSSNRRSCIVVGKNMLKSNIATAIERFMDNEGYDIVWVKGGEHYKQSDIALSEHLSCADIALTLVDSREPVEQFLIGAIRTAFIPTISFTANPDWPRDPAVPDDYHPTLTDLDRESQLLQDLRHHIMLFDQAFVGLDSPKEVDKYIDLLMQISSPAGHYDKSIRDIFVREINVGDNYKIGQAMAVGPNAQASHGSFQQIWSEAGEKIDLAELSSQLTKLRNVMRSESSCAERDIAIGAIAQAEVAAIAKDGPGAIEHLRSAGNWALSIAEKIGLGVAAAAIKTALGL